ECPAPFVLNAEGQCICPPGTVLKGRECVRQPPVCPPTRVLNAAGQCVCRRGTVLRGNRCVPRIQREHPAPSTPLPESRSYEGPQPPPPSHPTIPPPLREGRPYQGPPPAIPFPFPEGG